jgi:hypothetical protein
LSQSFNPERSSFDLQGRMITLTEHPPQSIELETNSRFLISDTHEGRESMVARSNDCDTRWRRCGSASSELHLFEGTGMVE